MATINGTASNDTLSGTAGDDTLNGFEGNDLFLAGSTGGNDVINGGGGRDSIEFKTRATSAIVVDFVAGTITGGSSGTISFTSIERILTGDFNDQLSGNGAGQTLTGQGGSDTIWGAGGVDTLWGGTGADSFVFRETGTGNADGISDFASGSDKIVLDASVMTELGASGNFAAGDTRFVANSTGTAQDASDRIIYETDTRQVWYDPDGTGAASRQLIATLQSGATLVATDIVVEGATAPGGAQTINGTAGNDSLAGGSGDDTINAFGGDDTIDGGAGADSMIGGAGADLYFVDNVADVIVEDQLGGMDLVNASVSYTLPAWVNNLTLTGTAAIDGTGNDIINVLVGNSASNALSGGLQADTLTGAGGADRFLFTTAPVEGNADSITDFASASDKIVLSWSAMPGLGVNGGFASNDARFAANSSGTAQDASDRVIFNTISKELFYDHDGNGSGAAVLIATLQSGATLVASDIVVEGGPTGQVIDGTDGDDSITGTGGNDTIFGHGGGDTISGGAGDDSIDGGADASVDWLSGADGNDTLVGGAGGDALNGGAGNDQLFGGDGDDHFTGGAGDDFLSGGAGRDNFRIEEFETPGIQSHGNDTIDGGPGELDQIFVKQIASLSVDLTAGTLTGGVPGSAQISNIEDIFVWEADVFDDRLVGSFANNYLAAGGGNDVVDGAGGDDWIDGGTGADTVTGGAGRDNFRFQEAPGTANADRITDFTSGVDTIWLDGHMHRGIGDFGRFTFGDERFYAAPGANSGQDATDRVVYDTSSGNLWFDGDGDGTGAAQLIATLGAGVTLNATDFMVENAIRPFVFQDGAQNTDIQGTELGDTLSGGGGNDILRGFAGDDVLNGESGNDSLIGGEGADQFLFTVSPGAADADQIADFASGSDKIVLGPVMTELGASGNFGAGDARFAANSSGNAQDADDRVIFNTVTRQLFYDLDGNGAGAKALIATLQSGATLAATDIVVEGGGPQAITGTEGNDSIQGTEQHDTIDGRGGNDFIYARAGDDLVIGGAGNDELDGAEGSDTLLGGDGDDVLRTWLGFPGHDSIDGGGGTDLLNLALFNSVSGYSIDLHEGTLSDTRGSATLAAIENVFSGAHNDNIAGNAVGNVLDGGSGNDTIIGRAGDDTLSGGFGADSLTGGEGADVLKGGAGGGADTLFGSVGADDFLFDTEPDGSADAIVDFASGVDELRFDGQVFRKIGPSDFASGDPRFHAAAGATAGHDADDRLIYNTTTRQVFYDADGSGSGAALLLAQLGIGTTLVATDIAVDNGIADQTINGTAGDDNLSGGQGDDTIDGLGGNDVLHGSEGADLLRGGAGNDRLFASDLQADGAADSLDGGLGDDFYWVASGEDIILDDPGGVDLVLARGSWTLSGGLENLQFDDDVGAGWSGTGNELNNRIESATEGGTLLGLGGNDTLVAQNAENFVTARGGEGDDMLLGSSAAHLFGDAGNDLLVSKGAFGILSGGAGADIFSFQDTDGTGFREVDRITDFASGVDTIRLDATLMPALGASGRFGAADGRFAANSSGTAQDTPDRLIYNTSNGDLWYDADGSGTGAAALIVTLQGAPTLAASDIDVVNGSAPGNVINGTSGNDTLTGTAGDDTINGLGGNDLFVAGSTGGNDVIDGGAGRDSIEFKERATSAITVDFVAGTITGGSSGTISFTNIERILTGNFDDTLTGNGASQTLTGQGGADTIAGAGDNDTLWGAQGADAFVFREMGTANADRISDFATGSDKIHLDDAAFTAIGAMGNFVAADARFKANSSGTATDTNDRVVFNTSTGQLYYDADGSGSGAAAQLIATVQSGAAVSATDIVVI